MIKYTWILVSTLPMVTTRYATAQQSDTNVAVTVPAATKKAVHKVIAGINIGAAAPLGLPDNIRKINSFNPLLLPSLGYEGSFYLCKKWRWGVGVRFDRKGMKVSDSVIYFQTLVQQTDGQNTATFEGAFSGTNTTEVHNSYITLPFFIELLPGKYWHYKLGFYTAFRLKGKFRGNVSDGYIRNGGPTGEKVIIDQATFDFSDLQRDIDYGLHAGVERDLGKRIAVTASLQWGLHPLFPASFTGVSVPMYNIFGHLGAAIRL